MIGQEVTLLHPSGRVPGLDKAMRGGGSLVERTVDGSGESPGHRLRPKRVTMQGAATRRASTGVTVDSYRYKSMNYLSTMLKLTSLEINSHAKRNQPND